MVQRLVVLPVDPSSFSGLNALVRATLVFHEALLNLSSLASTLQALATLFPCSRHMASTRHSR